MSIKNQLAQSFGISRTIYSMVYPEVRDLISQEFSKPFIRDIHDHTWTSSQDKYDDIFLEEWTNWASAHLGNLDRYNYQYPTNGSSEAIRDVIATIATRNWPVRNRDGDYLSRDGETAIHVLIGEYEGYEAYAKAYNVKVVKHDFHFDPRLMTDGDVVFISAPSAINGRTINLDRVAHDLWIANPNVMIMYDACYVGAHLGRIDYKLHNPNIHTVFFSLSKVFGVYYDRIGGVLSSDELPGLYGNMWFKNLNSLHIGTKLMREFAPAELTTRYGAARYKAREIAVRKIGEVFPVLDRPQIVSTSNVMPFTNITADREWHDTHVTDELKAMQRVDGQLRICITPVLDTLINVKGWRPSNEDR